MTTTVRDNGSREIENQRHRSRPRVDAALGVTGHPGGGGWANIPPLSLSFPPHPLHPVPIPPFPYLPTPSLLPFHPLPSLPSGGLAVPGFTVPGGKRIFVQFTAQNLQICYKFHPRTDVLIFTVTEKLVIIFGLELEGRCTRKHLDFAHPAARPTARHCVEADEVDRSSTDASFNTL